MKYYKFGNYVYAHDDKFTYLDFKYNPQNNKWEPLSGSLNLIEPKGVECTEKEIKKHINIEQLNKLIDDLKDLLS